MKLKEEATIGYIVELELVVATVLNDVEVVVAVELNMVGALVPEVIVRVLE